MYDADDLYVRYGSNKHRMRPATPDGCRHCGDERACHGWSYLENVGGHYWTAPSNDQRLRRMRARAAGWTAGN